MTDMMIAVKPDVLLRAAVVVALGSSFAPSPRDALSIAHDAGWMLHRRVGEGETLVVLRSLVREGTAPWVLRAQQASIQSGHSPTDKATKAILAAIGE